VRRWDDAKSGVEGKLTSEAGRTSPAAYSWAWQTFGWLAEVTRDGNLNANKILQHAMIRQAVFFEEL
jgi:hypothetical protein